MIDITRYAAAAALLSSTAEHYYGTPVALVGEGVLDGSRGVTAGVGNAPLFIAVSETLDAADQVFTLAHELAHVHLWPHETHGPDENDDPVRPVSEIAAQAAAAVVVGRLGLSWDEATQESYTQFWSDQAGSADAVATAEVTGASVGRVIADRVAEHARALLTIATGRAQTGTDNMPGEPLMRELLRSMVATTPAGVTLRHCIMEIHAGARLATMLQAVSHNLATVVADLAMVDEILAGRADTDQKRLTEVRALLAQTLLVSDVALELFGEQAATEHPTEPARDHHDHHSGGERSPLTFAQTQ